MKEQSKIPITKVQRASKFVRTGARIGGNYLKYYTKKALNQDVNKEDLDQANANDLYESLSQLKGSALKAAQMLSMDQGLLPKAISDKFQMAQYSAPPLSYPLVIRTFKKNLGKSPGDIFDTFNRHAANAASIGQVHKATLGDKTFAVKVQYPGVADSVSNDLKIAGPLAARMMSVNMSDLAPYMEEVEKRLLEETNYSLEFDRSVTLSEKCSSIPNVIFPRYYKEFSSERILTMDWIDGLHIKEWLLTNPSQESLDKIGQALWDFYNFQVHDLRMAHADPHPGNFLVTKEGKLAIIDFGCVKEIPEDFYDEYFQLLDPKVLADKEKVIAIFKNLDFLQETDDDHQKSYFYNLLMDGITLLSRPFIESPFDFSDPVFFEKIFTMAEDLATDKSLRQNAGARGSKHTIYVNRIYFGLFNILHELKARVNTNRTK